MRYEGKVVRPAVPGDYAAFARLFPQLEVDDTVPDRAHWERDLVSSTLIAESDGKVVGYCYCQELDGAGYVRNLVTAKEARRQGIGRALMEDWRARLLANGSRRWCLNVRPDNVAAVALYRSLGLSQRYHSASLRFQWDVVDRLPPNATDVTVRVLTKEDEAPFEDALGLSPGQLSVHRARSYVILGATHESGAAAGLAAFDPTFPGAFPFRAPRTDAAMNLLRAARAHALPEHSHMQVVVEDDPVLKELLVQAGATVRLEFVHYEGSLADRTPGQRTNSRALGSR